MPPKGAPRHATWSIEHSTIRTWSLVVIIPILVGSGVSSGYMLNNINRDIDDIKSVLKEDAQDKFTRAHMAEWCREFLDVNPTLKCPNPFNLPSFRR